MTDWDAYREVADARDRGEQLPRLKWAARLCVVLLALVAVALPVWAAHR